MFNPLIIAEKACFQCLYGLQKQENVFKKCLRRLVSGGRGEIRTHETLAGLTVFKTVAIDHSATLPERTVQEHRRLSARLYDR